ncbi:D-ribose pyranase [Alicyclobacillus contaminans]|uniref:D-ribose pyranase n=1 Tax=Alicyclobacillus contaminans TaxID=392016 RepID=UPI00041BB592|nr:D-ribose pyranase [Alicyclobacillus contaminans]GMA51383.1 D-ribose pyranase [Alicyclobacillus contaminans]
MKFTGILHGGLSELVARLGHGEEIVISDYGLPVPEGVAQIDLAVKPGVPAFLDVVETTLSELVVESWVLAEELKSAKPDYVAKMEELLKSAPEFVTHEQFKNRSRRARAVIRTGEWTPYANVILRAGVPF